MILGNYMVDNSHFFLSFLKRFHQILLCRKAFPHSPLVVVSSEQGAKQHVDWKPIYHSVKAG